MFKHMQTKHEQTNMFINICNKSWANKYVQTYANKNMIKQICSNQTCVNKPKSFLCSNMCTSKPLAWRSTHKISKNRPGGGRTIRGSETRGRSRPTNLSSTQHTPPPSSTDFWKIKPRGRCILICLMREQDMFPCSASIKNKKGQIYLTTNPIKETKTGNSNLANCYSFL